MERTQMESIPIFNLLTEALNSGGPFRLTSTATYSLSKVPIDKRDLFHNALLMLDIIKWKATNEEEVQFISNVIKEHRQINRLNLTIHTSSGIDQLADAIKSSKVVGIELRRDTNLTPVFLALRNVASLKAVKLYEGTLTVGDDDAIAYMIQNEQLEELMIDMPSLEVWNELTPVISAHTSLKSLEFRWASSKEAGLKAIAEMMSKNSSIQHLSIHPYERVNASDAHLFDALKSNPSLKSLEVSGLDQDETISLFEALAHNQVKLSKLKISNVTKDALIVLHESLSSNTMLTSFTVENQRLNSDTRQALCHVLKAGKKIKRFGWITSTIGLAGIKSVCELVNSNGLEVLQLSFSETEESFQDELKELAHMLRNNTSLIKFDLSINHRFGVNEIYEAMVHNTTVKKLLLTSRSRNSWSTDNITGMLVCNKTLRHLQVTVNPDFKRSYEGLLKGLNQNDSLTRLDIKSLISNHNNRHVKLARRILKVLEDNYALTSVSIESDDYSNSQFEALLLRNRQLQSSTKFKVAILSHNIARSDHALTILPREIWMQILSSVTGPGLEGFDQLVHDIFNSYLKQ